MGHLNFLTTEFGFIKMPTYQYVREIHTDYIGENIVSKIVYDGGEWMHIFEPKFDARRLILDSKKTTDYEWGQFIWHNPQVLAQTNLWKRIAIDQYSYPYTMWDYVTLLKANPEILSGDLSKLKWYYPVLRWLRIK